MKSIFVIVDLGISIRNILRTEVFKRLTEEKALHIVIFSPVVDEGFLEEFGSERVTIEPLRQWRPNPMVKLVQSLRKEFWAERSDIFTFKNRREKKDRKSTRLLIRLLNALNLGHLLDRTLDRLDQLEIKLTPRLEQALFDRFQPALVFSSSIYTKALAVPVGAKQRGIPVIGFMQSWDNPTSKGPFPFRPDKVIVWNEILRREIEEHHAIPAERIFVSGVPQFDLYTHTDRFLSRDAFFRKWRLDPSRRLITYTTGSARMLPDEHLVIDMLDQAMKRHEIVPDSQLLVRLHPKDKPEVYSRFAQRADIVVQSPGRVGATQDNWNPSIEDMYDLAELMYHSDVVVNIASTITIDAACLDTPVINVRFDGPTNHDYLNSCRRYYDYDHYRNILATGGVRIADTPAELVDAINRYLADPQLESAGRERIRNEQCWKLDGQSGRRIAEFLLTTMRQHQPSDGSDAVASA